MTCFLLWGTKGDVKKNVTDWQSQPFFHTIKVDGDCHSASHLLLCCTDWRKRQVWNGINNDIDHLIFHVNYLIDKPRDIYILWIQTNHWWRPVLCCIQVTSVIYSENQAETLQKWEREEKKSQSLAFDRWWLTGCCSRARNQTFSSAYCVCVCVCPEIGPQISNEHTANMKGFSICFHLHCLSNSIHHTTCLPVLLSENTRTGIAQNLCAVHNSDTVLFSTLCCSVTRFA